MRRTNLYLVALSALALATGCSSDETTSENYGEAISFSAVAGKSSRAVATTTNSIDNFKVYAFTKASTADDAAYTTYMKGVDVTKSNGSWDYSNHQFWPATAVNFFAVSPSNTALATVTDGANTLSTGTYTVDGTTDLLYSANVGATKSTSPVVMNFRHALSQIVFMVKNTNTSGIKVMVKDITVDGVLNSGSLAWASQTTGSNLTTTTNDTETGNTWGTWTVGTTKSSYTVSADAAFELTSTATYVKSADGDNGALFLLPQTLTEWNKLGGESSNNGSRLLVNCQIVDATSGIQLWPASGEYANVAIPLPNPTSDPCKTDADPHERWMQGKQYVYTIAFGEGGGYNPDPDPDDNPDPVLVPISFDVTVDVFQDGGSYDVDAATN